MTELGKLLDEAKASQQAAMGDKLVKYEALSQVDVVSTAHMKALAESIALGPILPIVQCHMQQEASCMHFSHACHGLQIITPRAEACCT